MEIPFSLTLTGPRLVTGPLRCYAPQGGPVVDKFGQWNRKDWPGKIRTDAELEWRMRAEDRELAASCRPVERSGYGGFPAQHFEPGGFFRVEQAEGGRWWLVDPEGCAFFSTGIDCTRPWSEGPVSEEHLPLFEQTPELHVREGENSVSPYTENLRRVYGPDWHKRWAEQTIHRHHAWGFNTIGNWSDPYLTNMRRLPYVAPLEPLQTDMIWRDFPDVCAPEFPAVCVEFASQTSVRRDDPMLIGHFLGNEPAWSRGQILAERILACPPSYTRTELLRRIEMRHGTIANLNAAWGTGFAGWEEIASAPWPGGSILEGALLELRELSGVLVERYHTGLINALRRADPHHLILGIRFAGLPQEDYCLMGMEL